MKEFDNFVDKVLAYKLVKPEKKKAQPQNGSAPKDDGTKKSKQK